MRELFECPDQGFALLKRLDRDNHKLAIFVHGFDGTHLTTWGDLPSCLQAHADRDDPLAGWDYLFFGYDTPDAPSLLSVSRRLATCIKDANAGVSPYDTRYQRFALFGHSLGTLAIRQLLCITGDHPIAFAKSLHAIVLFASPMDGSWMARWAWAGFARDLAKLPWKRWPSTRKVSASLRPGGPLIDMLRTWYRTIRAYVKYPDAVVVQGSADMVLGYDTAYIWHEDQRLEVPSGHIEIVKVRHGHWRNSLLRARIREALNDQP